MILEILDLMEERIKAKADIQKYIELDKQVKKRCNEAKEHWINTQCEEIEANNGVNSKTVHQKIKEVTGKKATAKTGCIRSKDGHDEIPPEMLTALGEFGIKEIKKTSEHYSCHR